MEDEQLDDRMLFLIKRMGRCFGVLAALCLATVLLGML